MASTGERAGILASSWYARMLGGDLVDLDRALDEGVARPLAWAVRRVRVARGLAIWALAGRGGLVLKRGERGAMIAIAASACFRRRRVVLLELAHPPRSRSRWRRAVRGLWRIAVERPALRRAVVAAQTATEAERELCSRAYGIPLDRIQHIPWAWCIEGRAPPSEPRDGGVLASGRSACDWPTLFAAAADRDWPLTVVCGRSDLAAVHALNADGRARVLCEIPREAHHRLLARAEVYAMALEAELASAGHLRLAAATDAGTPVVASAVPALHGYAIDGETALLVPPGDPGALRESIERLLADPALGGRLAGAALERARAWTYRDYFAAVRQLIDDGLGGDPIPARAPAAPQEGVRPLAEGA